MTIEKWGIFEQTFQGRSNGNPFIDYEIHGTFSHEKELLTIDGFYDGEGMYKIRFMPSFEGEYHRQIQRLPQCMVVVGE